MTCFIAREAKVLSEPSPLSYLLLMTCTTAPVRLSLSMLRYPLVPVTVRCGTFVSVIVSSR